MAELNVSAVKKLEADLLEKKTALKTAIVAEIGNLITQAAELGFSFALVENGNGKKIGRPRKEQVNGKDK